MFYWTPFLREQLLQTHQWHVFNFRALIEPWVLIMMSSSYVYKVHRYEHIHVNAIKWPETTLASGPEVGQYLGRICLPWSSPLQSFRSFLCSSSSLPGPLPPTLSFSSGLQRERKRKKKRKLAIRANRDRDKTSLRPA